MRRRPPPGSTRPLPVAAVVADGYAMSLMECLPAYRPNRRSSASRAPEGGEEVPKAEEPTKDPVSWAKGAFHRHPARPRRWGGHPLAR